MLYLFDIDGTLLLTGGAGTRAINAIFARHYAVADAMSGIQPGGKTDPLILTEIFENTLRRAPTPAELQEFLDEYVPLLAIEIAAATNFRTMPHAHECLAFLRERGVPLGIATGNVKGAARAKLDHIGLWDSFAFGGFGCDHPERGALVACAIERARAHVARPVAEEEIIVVGDTIRDIEAARACGVRVIAVATGSTSRHELAAADPDAVFDTLAELPAWHDAHPR
ncbi:MAG TPA: HAD family hydrolase [Kofleriaceae bacterium]|nr:HAD family hydrolase [Kofleriaceae bacterium]